MKNWKNKIFAAVITAVTILSGISAFAASPSPSPTATATARPRPDSSQSQTSAKASASPKAEQKEESKEETKTTTTTVVTTEAPEKTQTVSTDKKYTTRGGAFGWFILSVIVNAIISFAIGNRFYKMAKKDTNVSAEIRALRRDIDEKFVSNVGGFTEPATDIANSNEDYSTDDDGIKMPVNQKEEESAEETFRKWESQLAQQRAQRRAEIRESVKPRNPFSEEENEEIHPSRSQSYKPRRDAEIAEEEDVENEDEDFEDEFEERKIDVIKNKAKELITDIFPFKED